MTGTGRLEGSPRILLTNDDGIHAPGLAALERIAASLAEDIWVIAPATEQSGASHSLTLNAPLRMRRLGERRYSVDGTPTDCVSMAVKHILADHPPDLVLSGVNRGSNIAEDVTYSGTVAAAMEGTVLGIPAIALSQAFGFREGAGVPFEVAETHGPALIARLVASGWPRAVLINVNFPDCPPEEVDRIEVTRQGRRDQSNLYVEERKDPRGTSYYWLGIKRRASTPPEGTDLAAIYGRRISVTPLHLNLTQIDAMEDLARLFLAPAAGSD